MTDIQIYMKNRFIFTAILLFILSDVAAQRHHRVEVRPAVIEKEGDNIHVSFEVVPGKFPSDYGITLTPVVYNGDGEWKLLEPLKLVGKKRNIYDKRSGNLSGDRRVVDRNSPAVLRYTTTVSYEEWMQYLAVSVEQIEEGCGCLHEYPMEEIAGNTLLYYRITPYFEVKPIRYELTELEKYDLDNPFLHPMEDYDKRYDILLKDRDKGTSVVIFQVGSHKLDMNVQGNKDVLESVAKALELIESDPNAILKYIMVAGYASPEGSLAFNTALAQRRAVSVREFIQTLLDKPSPQLFEMYNGREDWNGLRERVDKSFMAEKEEILTVIDAYTMEQEERKTKLKQLHGGVPYRYMLENFYPPLRSAGYVQVFYEIDRTATVATAVTDEHGRTTWIDPDSPRNRGVTAINKALGYMVDHDFREALRILMEFREDARAWNHIGVCYMMAGAYDEAEPYLQQAADNGDENARKNLEQIIWARKVKR